MTLREWYELRQPSEQRTLSIGAAVVSVLLVVGGLSALNSQVESSRARVMAKQADLQWMIEMAPRVRAVPVARGNESLPLLIDRTARAAGLAGALSGSDPAGPGAIRVRFEEAPFDNLVAWLARVQRERGVTLDTATIDRTATEGLVNATLVLRGS
ncbi:MAG: type II secretion system protein GspM [Steroidobacteraceae bacterium]